MAHVAGPMDGGWRVIDVWESQGDGERFYGNELASAMSAHGTKLTAPVTSWTTHTVMSKGAFEHNREPQSGLPTG